mgnify:CR=1 FL=1
MLFDTNTDASLTFGEIKSNLKKLAEAIYHETGERYSVEHIPGRETLTGPNIEPILLLRSRGIGGLLKRMFSQPYISDDTPVTVVVGVNNADGQRKNMILDVDIRDHVVACLAHEHFSQYEGDVGKVNYRIAK